MATLTKITVTRRVVPHPTKPGRWRQVPQGTPGAVMRPFKSKNYSIVDRSGGRVRKVNTRCTDLRAAQAVLTRYHQNQERGEQGLTDPRAKSLNKPASDHVAEYMGTLTKRSDTHRGEVRRVLALAMKGVATLKDFTAERITGYLHRTPSAATGNKHRAYLSAFSNYVYRMDYVATNPIDRVDRLEPGAGEPEARTRRPYTEDELRRLMTAARTYPLLTRGENRGGRPRKDGTPALPRNPVELSDAYAAALALRGRGRELAYRLSLATGLRRGELSRVTVAMFNGRRIAAPKRILKHKPRHVTHLLIPLPPTLADALSAFVSDAGLSPSDRLVNVPCRSNYIREHKARLKLANVPYATEDGHADIHAFRTTANHYLKRHKVPLDARQRYMRHAAKDVTTKHYDPDDRRPVIMGRRVYDLLTELDRLVAHDHRTAGQGAVP